MQIHLNNINQNHTHRVFAPARFCFLMGFVVGVLMYDLMNPQHTKAERLQLNIFGYLDSGCALIEHKK